MKKIVLTSVLALAVTSAALAQGNVSWSSISFASVTAQTNTTTYSSFTGGGSSGNGSVGATAAGPSGATFYYALLYTSYSGTQAAVPTSLAALSTWSNTGLSATNSTSAGRLSVVNPNAGAQVPWSPGTTDSIVLFGWSDDLGTTYAQALANLQNWNSGFGASLDGAAAYFGLSNTGYITTLSTSTSPGAAVFGTAATAQGLPIFSPNTQLNELNPVSSVPEPGTMALAGLGGLSLLAFRRKK